MLLFYFSCICGIILSAQHQCLISTSCQTKIPQPHYDLHYHSCLLCHVILSSCIWSSTLTLHLSSYGVVLRETQRLFFVQHPAALDIVMDCSLPEQCFQRALKKMIYHQKVNFFFLFFWVLFCYIILNGGFKVLPTPAFR